MSIERRILALECRQGESRPVVMFGPPTPEQQRAVAQAARDGRRVIFWPVSPPQIESDRADLRQT